MLYPVTDGSVRCANTKSSGSYEDMLAGKVVTRIPRIFPQMLERNVASSSLLRLLLTLLLLSSHASPCWEVSAWVLSPGVARSTYDHDAIAAGRCWSAAGFACHLPSGQ